MVKTTGILDKIAAKDIEGAYDYVNSEFISITEFRTLGGYISHFLDGSTSYEIEQIGWYRYVGREFGGETYDTYSATFNVTVSENISFTLETVFVDGKDGICGIDLADTSFVDSKEKELSGLDVILSIYSFACFVFTVAMFIHCIRSKVLKKVRLALLTLVGGYIRFTLFETGITFSFMLTFLNASSGVEGNIAKSAVAVTLGVPVGAIIYFINRNKFKKKELPPQPEDYDPRAAKDGFSDNGWL
ncbi:MAG: hypothetical protein IJV70_00895 [Clostridia bacterium]|nr:hypothetical protein [Clostridia bacterium]